MTPSSQELGPPVNPGRFKCHVTAPPKGLTLTPKVGNGIFAGRLKRAIARSGEVIEAEVTGPIEEKPAPRS